MNKEDTTEITIENLLSKVRYYYPKDEGIIKKAFDLAFSAHDGQFRASGTSYSVILHHFPSRAVFLSISHSARPGKKFYPSSLR